MLKLFLWTFSFTLVLFQCGQVQTGKYDLSPKDFYNNMNSMNNKTILDVRTQNEFQTGHLKDAVCIDYNKNDFRLKANSLDKSKPIFLYCATGIRSSSASKILTELGFKEIYKLEGGINAWASEKRPIVK